MRNHHLIYQSSYDRGLEHLLKLWPRIIEKFPDATLSIAYGWSNFDVMYANNPERMEWKNRMCQMMTQQGIADYGKVSKEKLRELRKSAGILAYPTHFTETFCITAVECQNDGVVPVTMALAALKETVGCGVLIDGDIYDTETQEAWLSALLNLMADEEKWKAESEKGQAFAKQWAWDNVANEWIKTFTQ